MKREFAIGVSGHQARPGLDWDWTAARIREALQAEGATRALSSLAMGSDQVFAREALALGLPVTAVIPMPNYARSFAPEDLAAYEALLARCEILQLPGGGSDEEAFMAAGRRVAEACDLLIAVWDGKPAAGFGGTGDVVAHALEIGRPVLHLQPIARRTRRLGSGGGGTMSREGERE